MKRLYNEYSAAPHWEPDTQLIHTLVSFAAQRIWDEVVVMNDVCPRDAESQCHQVIATLFAENILRRAMDKRRKERKLTTLRGEMKGPAAQKYPRGPLCR